MPASIENNFLEFAKPKPDAKLIIKSEKLLAPKANEVTVKQQAAGINYIDIYLKTGLYPLAKYPGRLGFDGSGIIIKMHKSIKDFRIGDRVAYLSKEPKCYSEYVNIDKARLVKLPKQISSQQAASVMLKGLTAAYLIFKCAKIKANQSVLVHAAAGGVGHILCNWLVKLNVNVIACCGSDEKCQLVKKAKVKKVINYRKQDFVKELRKIYPEGVDFVLDGVGAATFEGSLACLKPRGLMVSFGNASGAVKDVDLLILTTHGSLFITRPKLNDYVNTEADYKFLTKKLVSFLKSGFKPLIHSSYSLAEINNAHKLLTSRETKGSIILKFD